MKTLKALHLVTWTTIASLLLQDVSTELYTVEMITELEMAILLVPDYLGELRNGKSEW